VHSHYHAVVWIDHHEARIVYFNAEEADETVLHPHHQPRHLHSRAGSAAGAKAKESQEYYSSVAHALAEAKEFLVLGPANAKTELVKHLHRHAPQLVERLKGVETSARLTDAQLAAEARRYFKIADKMEPQRD
jgi:stalled ribosome rescue protein Dom34